jgi:hypothetical protein
LLGACGGGQAPGADAPTLTAAGPLQAVTTLRMRAQALRAQAVAPSEAARQLMDFAEAQFPQFFPQRQPTQSLPPFAFRHYPGPGTYLGVVVTAGLGYEMLGVYVMGGPFGDAPLFVGPLASFITPSEPGGGGPGPTGSSNGCFDQMLAVEDLPGTRMVLVQRQEYGNLMSTTQTLDLRVRGPKTFDGQDAVENLQRVVDASFPEGIPDRTPGATDFLVYQRKTGPAEVTFYGSAAEEATSTSTIGGTTVTTTSSGRSVARPALVRQEFSLPLGGSYTLASTMHVHSKTTTTVGSQAPTTRESNTEHPTTETVRFLRRERITVPAGSFDACVFEYRWAEQPDTVTTGWVADGKGFDLKRVTVSGGTTSTSLTLSIRFNGQVVAR